MQVLHRPSELARITGQVVLGMQADYGSLIDKRQLDSLKKIREADTYSNKLLKVVPDADDAYLGLGTANYIIGSLPGAKKLFLGFVGVHVNKKKGIEELEIAAKGGHYLRPFAKDSVSRDCAAREEIRSRSRRTCGAGPGVPEECGPCQGACES